MNHAPTHCTILITCVPAPNTGRTAILRHWQRQGRLPLAAAIAKLGQAQRLVQALHHPETAILSRAAPTWHR